MARDGVFLRLDEPATDVLPSDSAGALADMNNDAGSTLPEVVEGVLGFAREFVAGNATGLRATDAVTGASLFTRTVSVQAILRWDFDDQVAAGTSGVVVCRGIRGSDSERVAYALALRVVNAGLRVGEMLLFWEDLAGNRFTATGGQFQLERASETMMITAVRRWSATRDVVVRYYLGDRLLNEAVCERGEIGGGTTGTTTIGGRITNGGTTWTDHFDGAIHELRIIGRELVAEEVAATWRRISVEQERGLQLFNDMLPPGLPISDDPTSRIQREHRLIGHLFGYASAQAENLRANGPPDRAYGPRLARWESITKQLPRPSDDVDVRRRNVLGHLASRAGVSPPGVKTALAELLGAGADQLETRAYDNTIRDAFDELVAQRWRVSPAVNWSVAGGELVVAAAGGSAASFRDGWRTCTTGVSGPERVGGWGAQLHVKLDPVTIPDGAEAGLMLYDAPRRDAFFFGLRHDGGNYKLVTNRWLGGIQQETIVRATPGLVPLWLWLEAAQITYANQTRSQLVSHLVRWSTTSASAGITTANGIDFSFAVGWAGVYLRSWNGAPLGGAVTAKFDNAVFRFPNGTRPFHFYVLRDPDLPGEYDLEASYGVLRRLRQSHTHAAAITRQMIAGDEESGCERGPCGSV